MQEAPRPHGLLERPGLRRALVENFRPGQLARLGLGNDVLRRARPDLVIAHISGFGQDGPYRDRAAFGMIGVIGVIGVIGEAIGGLRHLCNHPPGITDLPLVRVGVSIGDSLAGLYAAFGIMAALWQRDRRNGDGRGRTLDVALTNAVLSMMEGMLPEYSVLGAVREPTWSRIPTAAPTSAYLCSDGRWILIAANSEPLFARLAGVMGQPDLASESRFSGNPARVDNVEALDGIIADWTRKRAADEVDGLLTEADIPCTLIYTAAECAADPQFRARGMVRAVDDPMFGKVLHPGIVPHLSDDPGAVRWPGPEIGAHTEEVLGEIIGLGPAEVGQLRLEGVV